MSINNIFEILLNFINILVDRIIFKNVTFNYIKKVGLSIFLPFVTTPITSLKHCTNVVYVYAYSSIIEKRYDI